MEISFEKPMQIPQNISMIKADQALTFTLQKGDPLDSNSELPKIQDWNVISFASNKLILSLIYSDSLLLSQSKVKICTQNGYRIMIQSWQNLLSHSTLSVMIKWEKLIQKKYQSRKYLLNSAVKVRKLSYFISHLGITLLMEESGDLANTLIVGSIGLNFFLQMFLGMSMKKLWRLISTLQILVHLPMLSIPLPSNVVMVYTSLVDTSTLQLIPNAKIKQYLGGLMTSGTNQVKSQFQQMDIFQNNFKKRLFYAPLLRPIIKGYLKFQISAFITISVMHKTFLLNQLFDGTQQITEFLAAILRVVFLCTCTLIILFFLKFKLKKLKQKQIKDKYGSLYQDLKTTRVIYMMNIVLYLYRLANCGYQYWKSHSKLCFLTYYNVKKLVSNFSQTNQKAQGQMQKKTYNSW
ncbi:UNKNOWN [Stylonychia lemnae]|uniref:Transmembrane protein n=1 Tax=Stylonychia lemnae TaxID=5949 RepID=A0A078AUA1_STYLE|nr:UNKNOWN [Stylonychia lemnae]|eukprot:CDW85576.1 UNKNOWN [Stylonychia lemnae]